MKSDDKNFKKYKFKELKMYASDEWMAGSTKKYRTVFVYLEEVPAAKGGSLKIISTRTFKLQKSHLNEAQNEALEDVIWELQIDPTMGTEKKGQLRGFWYYDYSDLEGKKQIFYQFNETTLRLVAVYRISQKI